MHPGPKFRSSFLVVSLLMYLAVGLSGCSDSECHKTCCNCPPDTWIISEPPIRTCDRFTIEVTWIGTDTDGSVTGFEVATLIGEGFYVEISSNLDSLDWRLTTAHDSVFSVTLDSCCVSGGEAADSLAYWAVFVRAVDNDGARDPRPAAAIFKACNLLPKVRISYPDVPDLPVPCLPFEFLVEWEGEDPDGDDALLEYKYILVLADNIGPGPDWNDLPPLSHEGSRGGHAAPLIGVWSEWVPADCTYVSDLDVGSYPYPATVFKYFVVTTRDQFGDMLTSPLWSVYNDDENWFRFTTCSVGSGVEFIIRGDGLGMRSSLSRYDYLNSISPVFGSADISFMFFGLERRSSCEVATAYRYYYDDPTNPETSSWDEWVPVEPLREQGQVPEWIVFFPEDGGVVTPGIGRHKFVAEVMSLCGVLSHCELHFEVWDYRRPCGGIALIDDDRARWLEPVWVGYEEEQDAFWEDLLDGYDWEGFDTGREYSDEVPVELIATSSTVIWITDCDYESPDTQLLRVCSGRLGNYLHSFVKAGGNLIVVGRDAVYPCGYWPDGTPDPWRRVTYTSWDFRPVWDSALEETTYHWMWEVFGIEQMKMASPPVPFTALWPCDGCHGAFPDTIELGPQASRVGDSFSNAIYVTELREGFSVTPLYSTAIEQDEEWIDSGDDYLIAVYVPADGARGHAAYIGVAEYWFDHDKMKTMIRELLELFGESP